MIGPVNSGKKKDLSGSARSRMLPHIYIYIVLIVTAMEAPDVHHLPNIVMALTP